jgi:carbamoyltransferase
MLIVGLNAYHGDVAAAVLRDGALVAALEEERFSRIKHVAGFPARAILEGLKLAGASAADVDIWAVARGKNVHLWRKAWFGLTHRPRLALLDQYRVAAAGRANLPQTIARAYGLDEALVGARTRYVEHHPAHLASAYFVSGMSEAACCAIDGFGDFVSASVARGRSHRLDVLDRVFFPHSLGLLYLALTQYLGFTQYGDEFKVMGLAPYGRPRFAEAIARLVRLDPAGRFRLDLEYFRHWTGEVTMQWDRGEPTIPNVFTPSLVDLLGPPRSPDEPITGRHEDVAASVQQVFEQAAFHVLRGAHDRVPVDGLCLAGGCAMNSVANGKIRAHTPFRRVYVQPAAGDNGTALGAALIGWHARHESGRGSVMTHAYWGTSYDARAMDEAVRAASAAGAFESTLIPDEEALCRHVAGRIANGAVVGWFQGRMEWGARALGHRSILADPRRRDMRDVINEKIKFRERFRPFAPSILEEAVDEYFVGAAPDPYMMHVYPIRPEKRDVIPAVTHVDGTGRLQSVSRESAPRYWALIAAFRDRTGVPVLLNTSFNENEPIVERPEQAINCFLRTGMDLLVLGDLVLEKRVSPRPATR